MAFIKGDKVKFIGDSDTHSLMFQNYLLTHENIFTLKDIDTKHNCNRYSIEEINYVWLLENEIELIEDYIQCKKYKIKNEEINMENKDNLKNLIGIWQDINRKEIYNKYEKEKEELINKDPNIEEYDSLEESIRVSCEEYNTSHIDIEAHIDIVGTRRENLITEGTKYRIKELEEKKEEKLNELRNIANQAYNATSIYTSEDNIKKTLEAYDIIDKKGKIKIL